MAATITYRLATVTGPFVTDSFSGGAASNPDVLGLPSGGFVCAYLARSGSSQSVLVDFYDPGFQRMGTARQPFEGPTNPAGQPQLALLTNGNVLVIWDDDVASDPGLRGRLYRADGVAIGGELKLGFTSSDTGNFDPHVAALAKASGVEIRHIDPDMALIEETDLCAGSHRTRVCTADSANR